MKQSIEIGSYVFSFPHGYTLKYVDTVDSLAGFIERDGININFNLGYASSVLSRTPQEYIASDIWRVDAIIPFLELDTMYQNQFWDQLILKKVEKEAPIPLNPDRLAYVATCQLLDTTFLYTIEIPKKISTHEVKMDTIAGHYRRIVKAKYPESGINAMHIYDLDKALEARNTKYALRMIARDLSAVQQDSILNIFRSVKLKQ